MRLFLLRFCILWSLFAIPAAQATPLVASLDSHTVAISIDFTGNEVLLFGSVDSEGDIIVLVQGPRETATVRKKERTAVIWHNAESIRFTNVPGYYAVSYSGDGRPELSAATLKRHEIGAENIDIRALNATQHETQKIDDFRKALIEERKRQNRISDNDIKIERLGDNLFRTSFFIPSNAPVGTYRTEVFLVDNGKIINAQATPLFVSKTGIEAHIYNFAYNYSAFYGVMAILLAALSGYLANMVMRKK